MAKPKYSPETKLAVVNHYLSGKDGEQSTADLFGIERTSVRRWVRAWQFHGAEGLTAKNNHYSDEFKLVVVRAVISDRLTMREAAARFNLSAEILVRRWLNAWQFHGAEGLTAKNNHYSDEFKLVVVRAVISDRLTMREAAARFNLSAEILVRRWLDVYNDAGAEGLLNMQCGRPGQMTKPKNIPPLTDKEL
ncbi:transposase, partial [Klebsiella pneumoniae]|uniref:transposase n=1 Tax=Klebsiella pneumoniae TaxID=573 RepID=UPI00286FE1F1